MSECKCKNHRDHLILFICNEIEALEMETPWTEYLAKIDDKFKKASVRWTFTKTESKVWFLRVLANMSDDELIEWAHVESICLDQF